MVEKRKNRKRQRNLRLTYMLCSLLAAIIILISGTVYFKSKENPPSQGTDENPLSEELRTMNLNTQKISFSAEDLQLNSSQYLLIKADNGEILADNGSDTRIYPASMTKIMTGILALENLTDLDQTIQLPGDIFQELWAENASMAGFEPGETATVRDLVYGVILPSGGECSVTLAKQISGSESAFVDLMNQKAAQLGMKNTNFCNATGLHDEQHYTTANDMAVLLQYALQNGHFRAVFTKSRYTTSGSSIHPDGFTFTSTMFKHVEDAQVTGGELLGGKTGYTSEAGQCLASLANIGGEDYILVTAGAHSEQQDAQPHIDDALTVYQKLGEKLQTMQ